MFRPMIPIHCVFGPQHVEHIKQVLVPSLKTSRKERISLKLVSYSAESVGAFRDFTPDHLEVTEFLTPKVRPLGFAAGQNLLAANSACKFFIIINPDCIAFPHSLDRLIHAWDLSSSDTGIIEGRQWPFAHPKEYDPHTFETPWASGAFALINAEWYRKLGGMDERYFLYHEDVDLSWRMWLNGASVLFCPAAAIIHFSGGPFYRDDLIENETYYGTRNYILILRKFFGYAGEARGIADVTRIADARLVAKCLRDIAENFGDFKPASIDLQNKAKTHSKIKVLGYNKFHETRQ